MRRGFNQHDQTLYVDGVALAIDVSFWWRRRAGLLTAIKVVDGAETKIGAWTDVELTAEAFSSYHFTGTRDENAEAVVFEARIGCKTCG